MNVKKLLVILVMLVTMNASAQWQPDMRLTNDSNISLTSSNNSSCIASNGSVVHTVWKDYRDGNSEIYYKRSTNTGISWGADTRLTNNTADSWQPTIAVSGSVVHVVWNDNRDGNYEIYYKRSTDGGVSWGTDKRLTNNIADAYTPSVAVSGSVVHVVWSDLRDGNYEIYYKLSMDGGVSWGTDIRLTNNTAYSYNPSVKVSGSVVHVVCYDNRDGNYEIYYKRSTDGGLNWGIDTRLTNNTAPSITPSVEVSGSFLHVLWTEYRDTTTEIYYKRSTDGGLSWGIDTRLTNNFATSLYPSVSVSGSAVHIVWQDDRDGNDEIYYKLSTNAGASWGTDTRLTNNFATSLYPSVAVSGSVIHVVWQDYRDGNDEIYYKRNPTGNPIGIQNISTETPSKYSLSQNYPNPFNPTTNIKFSIINSGDVKLVVYDIQGREVQTLVNERLNAGTYEVKFDGSMLTSGVYFYKMVSEGFTETKRMILIK